MVAELQCIWVNLISIHQLPNCPDHFVGVQKQIPPEKVENLLPFRAVAEKWVSVGELATRFVVAHCFFHHNLSDLKSCLAYQNKIAANI